MKYLLIFSLTVPFVSLFKNLFMLAAYSVNLLQKSHTTIFFGIDYIYTALISFSLIFFIRYINKKFFIAILTVLLFLAAVFINADLVRFLGIFRLLLTPILILIIAQAFLQSQIKVNYQLVTYFSFIVIAIATVELIFGRLFLYEYLNVNSFSDLKYHMPGKDGARTNHIEEALVEAMTTKLPFDILVSRLLGPVFHPVTYGYLILFSTVWISFCDTRKLTLKPFIFFPLSFVLLALSSKGALLIYVFLFFYYLLYNYDNKLLKKRSIFMLIISYFLTLMFLSIYTTTSLNDHLNFLINAIVRLQDYPFGSLIGFTSKADTFVGLLIYNYGIFSIVLIMSLLKIMFFKLSLNKTSKNYQLLFIYLILMCVNSIIHVEPFSIASLYFPLLLIHLERGSLIVYKKN